MIPLRDGSPSGVDVLQGFTPIPNDQARKKWRVIVVLVVIGVFLRSPRLKSIYLLGRDRSRKEGRSTDGQNSKAEFV